MLIHSTSLTLDVVAYGRADLFTDRSARHIDGDCRSQRLYIEGNDLEGRHVTTLHLRDAALRHTHPLSHITLGQPQPATFSSPPALATRSSRTSFHLG